MISDAPKWYAELWLDKQLQNAIAEIAQLTAENADLREQLRWRNTLKELPAHRQNVITRPRLAIHGIGEFIYDEQYAEDFRRYCVEWLPIPEEVVR